MEQNSVFYHLLVPDPVLRPNGQASWKMAAQAPTIDDALKTAASLKLTKFAVVCAVVVYMMDAEKLLQETATSLKTTN